MHAFALLFICFCWHHPQHRHATPFGELCARTNNCPAHTSPAVEPSPDPSPPNWFPGDGLGDTPDRYRSEHEHPTVGSGPRPPLGGRLALTVTADGTYTGRGFGGPVANLHGRAS